ncbi:MULTISPECIES: transporter substrate-binding domain-containing protein [Lachnospiraceae]|jgi:ABC-type amino acid transport substrate-binding protein|uniref:Transporter substrate-binding domain-containing protein n=1 Tax=Faecalicatena acetigenes TaxID=2981790 RepID=A0ABT2TAZ8_9FIRM|nr:MULTISPECIES: transporter substrate-binding domain-containing protein [Lachnospiraceae]MCU6747450.1 transporter substrate-binding domain-containing protein [Faecalicatena acetigenes]SCH90279.1 Arginine-binding extracellular protein ArtP precursor [uncultured Clostridium sp.]
MKKFLALCLTAALVTGMAVGCGSKEEGKENSSDDAKGGAVSAKVIDVDLTNEEYAFGVDKNQPELLEEVNAFIAEIKEDGTLDEICDKYFGGGEPEAVKSAKLDEAKDQLVVATNAAFEPFEYTKGEDYYGIDMEIASLLADKLGKELVIQNMDFDAVCLSVGQEKCDIAMAGLTISEDRKEYVTFTDSYYQASQRLIVPSDNTEFDDLKDAEAIAAKLGELKESDVIGVQQGTTGQSYVEGSEDLGFPGLPAKCQTYKSGSLAVQDMLNGNIQYVIIDAAPATAISESINEML